jgi:hypothetical protein
VYQIRNTVGLLTIMCVMTPYTLVCGYRRHHRNISSPISLISSEDVGSGILGNAGTQIPDYTASLYKYHNPDIQRDKYFKSCDPQYVFV